MPAEGPVNTPADASGAKFFSRRRSGHIDIATAAKIRDNPAARPSACAKSEAAHVAETLISSAFLRCRVFSCRSHRREKIFAAASRRVARCALRVAGGHRSYAQNQGESLLIFFCCSNPVVVPVDSRRHCTDVAIHQARRAAMAKKRKYKAPKKAKKRRKKK